MQATLDTFSLKAFTKALTCLSKYGDELSIYATADYLSFSATNSSKSAFCLFKYDKQFFSRYKLGKAGSGKQTQQEDQNVTGQLTVKSFLSILKHRTVEKAVERCELAIVEGDQASGSEDEEHEDSLESKLIVRFHCKHGVIKTHRLVLLTPGSIMTPGTPDATNESRLVIGPKPLRDLLEHFPVAKGARSDPQLVWTFEETEVSLKSIESSIDSRGKGQLSTEISISSDEFDVYDIYETPITLGFHLREFNATIAFADSVSLSLEMRFTDPAIPLFIEMEGDGIEILFVISTSQVQGAPVASQRRIGQTQNVRKREREFTTSETPRIKKPMKAAQSITLAQQNVNESRAGSCAPGSMPPPSAIPSRFSQDQAGQHENADHRLASLPLANLPPKETARIPLFLPSSQMSMTDEEALKALGLDADGMDADQLADLLEGEGEEVDFSYMSQPSVPIENMRTMRVDNAIMDVDCSDELDIVDDPEFTVTQRSELLDKTFQPLFED